ncbi:cytochrome P450 [Granulicella sp. S190]|uniref:cytochrome P450 n=1 Tax=Granulicella sp. S190 TaxID=1747226 RepID=UPI00131E921E|nr:cytochrome P450 [Granulicella sp. S190]
MRTEMEQAPLPCRRDVEWPCNPAPELRELCEEQPVASIQLSSGSKAWLISRDNDARQVLADPRFSSAPPPGTALPVPEERTLQEELSDRQPGTFLEYDEPHHTQYRNKVAGEFTPASMDKLRPMIERIVDECLDATEEAGSPVDLVQTFALPMPSRVICEMLGIPRNDTFDFATQTRIMTDLMAPPEDLLVARDAMRNYMRAHVKRTRAHPGDNLFGRLVTRHGDELDDEELTGIGNLLLIAGHETTAMTIGLSVLTLLQHPDQLAVMRGGDPQTVNAAVEELLRYTSIANHGAVRIATESIEVGGQLIGQGEIVVVSIPMANRDPKRYDQPYQFDIGRRPQTTLAFGHGIHRCVAAPMAMLELKIALPALFDRFPNLQLAVPLEKVAVRKSNATHGVDSLPVTW